MVQRRKSESGKTPDSILPKSGSGVFKMSDGGDNPFKELKIFPEGVFCPLPKQDSGEMDSKLLIGRTVDDALNYFNNKLKSLRGRISDAEYAALEKELFEFQRRLGSLTSSNAGATGNNRPDRSLFKATITHTHKGRTVNVGILNAVGDRVNFLDAHRLVDDFNRQHNTNVKLITPHLVDAMLNDGTDAWRFFHDNKCYPLLTNALVAYEAPSKKLGKEIVLLSENNPTIRLFSTGKYAGRTGVALFISDVTSRDLQISGADIVLDVPDSRIQAVDGFPSKDGWYTPDPVTTIPRGVEVGHLKFSRYLYRHGNSYVGPVARGCSEGIYNSAVNVYSDLSLFYHFGVAVEHEV